MGKIVLPEPVDRARSPDLARRYVARLRIIGIVPGALARVPLLRDGQPEMWRATANDGANLPTPAASRRPADFMLSPGEIIDFGIVPEPGELPLEVELDTSAKLRAWSR
jgi:hypothetical protein